MKKRITILIALVMMFWAAMAMSVSAEELESDVPSVMYQTHVQNVGWQDYVTEGKMSGTEGMSYRLEGMRIGLDDAGYDLGIQYQSHIQNIGWEEEAGRGWKIDKQMSGTEGLGYRLEAIQIKLTGTDAEKFDIYYQVHAQNMGWLGWAKNGESAGTAAYGYRLEGIKIVIVPTGGAAPEGTVNKEEPFYQDYLASYTSIINDYELLDTTKVYNKTTMPNVNTEFWLFTKSRNVQIYYLLEDLSGDSVPELIISDLLSGGYNIVDTYKLVNGKPQRIFDINSMGHRAHYYICENQVIKLYGSSGATNNRIEYYYLDGINQNTVFQVISKDNDCYTIDAGGVRKTITQDEFSDYSKDKKNYEPLRTDLNWIKL